MTTTTIDRSPENMGRIRRANMTHAHDAAAAEPCYVPDSYHPGRMLNAEPGVRYVLRQLMKLGARPVFSCEGHEPHLGSWYVFACASPELVERVKAAWPFYVDPPALRRGRKSKYLMPHHAREGEEKLILRLKNDAEPLEMAPAEQRTRLLRGVEALEAAFGPLITVARAADRGCTCGSTFVTSTRNPCPCQQRRRAYCAETTAAAVSAISTATPQRPSTSTASARSARPSVVAKRRPRCVLPA